MRKILLPFMVLLLFASCQKEIATENVPEELATTTAKKKAGEINSVKICKQVWMSKNLDVSTYRDGTSIPQVTDPVEWANLTTGAWCYYENNSANGTTYGKLYNWYAVNDPRGLAPGGWHIPSDAEWTTLTDCLDGESLAGGKMKESGTSHWLSPNTGATNSSGFTGLPGGGLFGNGPFSDVGSGGYWWSSNEGSTTVAWARGLFYSFAIAFRGSGFKSNGFSVRCVRD